MARLQTFWTNLFLATIVLAGCVVLTTVAAGSVSCRGAIRRTRSRTKTLGGAVCDSRLVRIRVAAGSNSASTVS